MTTTLGAEGLEFGGPGAGSPGAHAAGAQAPWAVADTPSAFAAAVAALHADPALWAASAAAGRAHLLSAFSQRAQEAALAALLDVATGVLE